MKPLTRNDLENFGSLITIKGTNNCLGDLLHFPEHGTFDPSHGRVEVSAEEAQAHNEALSEAMLDGMDKNCEIGQGAHAYFDEKSGEVHDFIGTLIAPAHKRGKTITFFRRGKTYRGYLSEVAECFNYKRIK